MLNFVTPQSEPSHHFSQILGIKPKGCNGYRLNQVADTGINEFQHVFDLLCCGQVSYRRSDQEGFYRQGIQISKCV
jgi:hypothetical protein